MEQYLPFLIAVAKYLGAVGVTLIALRASWEMSQGKGLKSLIINFLGFLAIFGCTIVFMPKLFNWGLDKVYAQIETSPHVGNVEKIIGTGYNLISSAGDSSASAAAISIPELPVVTGNGEPAVTFSAPPAASSAPASNAAVVAPAANSAPVNTTGPSNPNSFHPAQHELTKPEPTPWTLVDGRTYQPNVEMDAKLPIISSGHAGPGGETLEQYKARTGDGGGGPQSYTVQSGDSLGKIAKRLNISVAALCQANRGVVRDCNVIRSGWVLAIP